MALQDIHHPTGMSCRRQPGGDGRQLTRVLVSSHVFLCVVTMLVMGMTSTVDACQKEKQPAYCYSEYGDFYQQCPMTRTKKIRCKYALVDTFKPLALDPETLKLPGAPRNFEIKSYTTKLDYGCYHVFNFTWKLPQDSSVDHLEGFLLNVTFTYEKEPRRILRLFNITAQNLTVNDLMEVIFFYDCFVPVPNALFRIELRSLPLAPHGMQNYVLQLLQTQDEVVDFNNTANWKSSIWVTPSPALASIEVCFTLAPAEFRFTKYGVFLVGFVTEALRIETHSATVETDQEKAFACHTFSNVCPDFYRIEVEPKAMVDLCNCKIESKCVERCSASVFQEADMTQSKLSCPVTVIPHPKMISSTSDFTGEPGRVLGVVLGCLGGIVVVILLALLAWRKWPSEKQPRPKLGVSAKKVAILYSSNGEADQEMIRSLAEFLREHCACEVVSRHWLEATEDAEFLSSGISVSDAILLVMSQEVCRRFHESLRGEIRPPERRESDVNLSVVADLIRLPFRKDYESVRRKCFQVCLPCSTKIQLLEDVVERYYDLRQQVDAKALVEDICGRQILSKKRKKVLREVTAHWEMNPRKITEDRSLLPTDHDLERLQEESDGNDVYETNFFDSENFPQFLSEFSPKNELERQVSGESGYMSYSLLSGRSGGARKHLGTYIPPDELTQSTLTMSDDSHEVRSFVAPSPNTEMSIGSFEDISVN